MTRPACRCGCGKIPKSATAMYWPGHSQRGVLKHTDELLTELRKWFADHGGKPAIARAGLALVVVWEIDLEDDMRGTLTAALCDRRVGAT